MTIEFRVLGPLEVLGDDGPRRVSSAKQRLLLGLLLARANHPVTIDALIEGLWPTGPPATATAVLHTHVSQLRKHLETPQGPEPHPPRALLRTATGYQLVVAPDRLDSARFEAHTTAARNAADVGRFDDAAAQLGRALRLWRGSAFGELAHEPAIQPVAQRLDELLLLACEHETNARMALGRHGEAIGELEGLIAQHPLRERSWAQLMVCLYRSGRQADALHAYQRVRALLADELGLEPGAELRQLEQAVLQHSPTLDWTPATTPHPGTPGGTPTTVNPPGTTSLTVTPAASVKPGTTGPATLAAAVVSAGPGEPTLLEDQQRPPAAPEGLITFLMTDIEGSTRRWDEDPAAMRAALGEHDRVLREAISSHGGHCFKHTGDGMCAAFAAPSAAIAAAVTAQRALGLPVRMGIATGEADHRDGDYFGPALNRTARVMAAGHGGMILVSQSTAALVDNEQLASLGAHRLQDLSSSERLFVVRAEGLATGFAPLRTLDVVPGNLPSQATSFLGRDLELKQVVELVQAHRLVTLTGVGGVGKTRLALQSAGELVPEFPDGVWFVELAPVGGGASVPDAVANALQIAPTAGVTITQAIAEALSHRRTLIVLDNCEHVVDAAADLLEAVLLRSNGVQVLATSRQGLGLADEHLFSVPALEVDSGTLSAGVELFVERARAVVSDFELRTTSDATAVIEICRGLDGIPLAIELAAARMVSLGPGDIRDRLADRFRLLSGSRRAEPRHRTLRNVVQWSFDLLEPAEASLLTRCSVFADGFDLDAATQICGNPENRDGDLDALDALDEFEVLDLLDSLVRKSLITVDRTCTPVRFGMLETIRQFGDGQLLPVTRTRLQIRHAHYFARRVQDWYSVWHGPWSTDGVDYLERNFANIRTGFRWAVHHDELAAATAIAAHTAMMIFSRQVTEPIRWAEELVPAAIAADVAQLPRLLNAATLCAYTGNVADALRYSELAMKLERDPRYDPYEYGMASIGHANARLFNGEPERWLEICSELARSTGLARRIGLVGLLNGLPGLGRGDEARAIADDALTAVRQAGDPFWGSFALLGYGRAFADTDPAKALRVLREAVAYTREHRMTFWEAVITREAASIEGLHGDPATALGLFEQAIASQHRAMNVAHLAAALASLAVLLTRLGASEIAATVYGSTTRYGSANRVKGLRQACADLEAALGPERFEECVARGAALGTTDAVHHAIEQIRTLLVRFQTVGQ